MNSYPSGLVWTKRWLVHLLVTVRHCTGQVRVRVASTTTHGRMHGIPEGIDERRPFVLISEPFGDAPRVLPLRDDQYLLRLFNGKRICPNYPHDSLSMCEEYLDVWLCTDELT